ncbi:FAD-dependent oxidoreductase [Butyrivibrio proteoclasticus]|uniref:oxidoreductase n=1 Tax=Butyrivibrio proteoclasticus TaxID=43305 RepID=UPI00047C958C|nr:FAD-dependent oxidoreductase [Butyrivibrio proteoclasticus]
MKQEYEALFTPWKIGNLEIKNRIVLAPMGGTCIFGWMEPGGSHFDKEAARLLLKIAQNDCGLVIPGIAPVKDMLGGKWLYQNKKKFKELKVFMDQLHDTGAKMFVQMTAGFGRSFALTEPLAMLIRNKTLGKASKFYIDPEYLTAAPSVLPNRWADDIMTRPLTKKEIDDIVYAFGETARLCKEAGVDGVEVHAVHEGYLLDQFTLKYTNHRTDEYGGSFENRYRFAVEIVKEIKAKCGEDFPVSLRYSVRSMTKEFQYGAMPGEDFEEIGRDMEESEKAAKYLQDAGYDMLNCDNGTYDAWYWAHPPQYMPQNCNLKDVEHIKKFVDIPVVCAGKMEPSVGAKAIREGGIDAMAVGRQFLADPRWVTKIEKNKERDIRPCICCHTACFNLTKHGNSANDQDLSESAGMCRCAVNPRSMQSGKYRVIPTDKPKKVAIIGGGIGGMEAARILALRGHEPVLYEKTDELGGVFIAAAAPEFKEKDKELIEWQKRQLQKLGIEVHMNTEIKEDNLPEADAYIVATGAEANHIPIPGADRAMDATDYLLGKKDPGDNVVIIGGGLTGCEIALDLFRKGKHPQIVEMKDDLIAVKNMCLANTSYLRDCFKTNKVPVYLKASVDKIGEDSVTIYTKSGTVKELKADGVIMSVGYHATPLLKASKNVYLLGDCKKVGNVKSAIWGAWDIAMKI